MQIRIAKLTDLPKLVEIYNQAILARKTADLIEFSVAQRMPWFESHQNERYPLFVLESAQQLLGYATLSQYRGGRPALQKTVEVSYYIHPEHYRKGYGSALLSHAITEAKQLGYRITFALLLDSNEASIALLEKFGFEKWGHLPDVAEIDGSLVGHLYYGLRL